MDNSTKAVMRFWKIVVPKAKVRRPKKFAVSVVASRSRHLNYSGTDFGLPTLN